MRPLAALALCASLIMSTAATASAPAFEDYLPHAAHDGPNAEVQLVTEEDRMFRTRLREGAREPADFSGRYKVVTWGCGTSCLSGAVIDTSNGRVVHLPEVGASVDYRLDSSLISILIYLGGQYHDEMYFQFTGDGFTYITTIEDVFIDWEEEDWDDEG